MDLLEAGSGDTALENAIVLLGIHVERFLVHGSVILELIHGMVGLSWRLRLWLRLGVRLGTGGNGSGILYTRITNSSRICPGVMLCTSPMRKR